MAGLSKVFKIDNRLINENEDFVFLYDEYKEKSLLSFCINGKFLDEM